MTATFHILTLTPTKRGRKYFTCSLPDKGYAVKLVIDSLSQDLALDVPVAIRAKDLSRHSAFGSQFIYEAMQILRGQDQAVIKIAKTMDRAFQKANFRGVEVDISLGVQEQWRPQFYSDQVQARWDARRAKRQEKAAWKYAQRVLPNTVYAAMTRPGVEGVREALVGDAALRFSTMEACRQWLEMVNWEQSASAMHSVPECRERLNTGLKWRQVISIWEVAAGIIVASQFAEEAQIAVEATLAQSTPAASTTARPVRL